MFCFEPFFLSKSLVSSQPGQVIVTEIGRQLSIGSMLKLKLVLIDRYSSRSELYSAAMVQASRHITMEQGLDLSVLLNKETTWMSVPVS